MRGYLVGNDVGRRIAAARRDRGWDQTELARRAGVAGSYISRLENGKFDSPSAVRLAAIADALGRRINDLTEPQPAPDESEDAALRRLLEAKVGKANAPIIAAMLPKLRGLDPDEAQKLAEIVAIMISLSKPRTGHRAGAGEISPK